MSSPLGRLERVDLRTIWATEDRDFTPWLAYEEHLELLANTIGMELELEAQEKEVGPFRADILCKNVDDDSWVLIENQIERTDHRHLGQLLTYAAGLQAVTIVWIASRFTEEHRETLDWLNKITDDNFRFFGLEVELWRIDESQPAPKFNIVSQPNNWSKSITKAAKQISERGITETKALQHQYWQELVDYLQHSGSDLRLQAPRPRHWHNFSVGKSGVKIATTNNTRDNFLSVQLYIYHPEHSKAYFHLLKQDKQQIEKEIGQALDWQELPEKTATRIALYKQADSSDKSSWPEQHQWFKENVELFYKAFRPRIIGLNPDEWETLDEEAA